MNHGVMACATHESTDRLARRRLPEIRQRRTVDSVRNTCGCGDAQRLGRLRPVSTRCAANAARMYRQTSEIVEPLAQWRNVESANV